jgi:transposase
MESTSVYWIPVYQILEARGLEVYLVNAQHVKNGAAATARKPMSEDAKKRIAEGLRKAREAKKAALIVVSEPQTPAPPFADALVAISPRESRSHRKAAKEDDATAG